MYGIYLGLVVMLCCGLIWKLRFASAYVICVVAFVQNVALPFMYTSLGASQSLLLSLLLVKEILLLLLFLYSVYLWQICLHRSWPKPIVILFWFSVYCVARVLIGVMLLSDDPFQSFIKLRMVCFPLQIVTIAFVYFRTRPKLALRFVPRIAYVLAGLALVGILMFILPASDFWTSHANIATYSIEVKGDDPSHYVESEGISGTGRGRESFLDLAPFRAFGTFGDPLAMGFGLAPAFLLWGFLSKKKWLAIPLAALTGVALFVTFDRSVWIFVFLSGLFIFFKRRRYKVLALFALCPIVAILTIPPLAQFATVEFGDLSWSHPGGDHAQGIVWFYQRGFTDPGNVLGKGMRDDVRVIPESGYAFLLEHFGLTAYVLWLWFLCSAYRQIRLRDLRHGVALIARAMIPAIFVVMHFSQYPFTFIGWIFIWYIIGISMGGADTITLEPARARVQVHIPRFATES